MKKIFIILIGVTLLLFLTNCSLFEEKYAEVEEYILTDVIFEHDGVNYTYSNKGWIVTSLSIDSKEVTIHPKIDDKEVYAVSSGFLKDNNTIETLNLPSSKMFFERNCISNCKNLKEINLKEIDNCYNQELEFVCEKKAFDLVEDCYFYIHNIKSLDAYLYGFRDYINKFKLLSTLYIFVYARAYITNFENYSIESSNINYSITGTLFGLLDIDISKSKDSLSTSRTVELITDTDFFIKNNKFKMTEIKYSFSASAEVEKKIMWGVTKDYYVSCGDEHTAYGLSGYHPYSSGDKPQIRGHLEIVYTYDQSY